MNHPPHSTTTASSASGQADFNGDFRIIAPFLSTIRKTFTLSTHEKNLCPSGHRHQSFPGHPVYLGYVLLGGEEWQTPFCVTGDTDDEDNVKLMIQDKNRDGSAIPISEETLLKAMKKAQGMTQMDILRNLEVTGYWWMDMIETNKSELLPFERCFRENAKLMRDDFCATYFENTIIKYVVHTIANARCLELGRFLLGSTMRGSGGLAEVYNDCGWTDLAERKDLAELNPEKLAKEYENKLVVKELPL